MAKKKRESIEEKLEYLGLNLESIPASIKKFTPLEYRVSKQYEKKQYRQYRYVPIKDIQILLSPTNRLDDIEEKYKKASPLADYLDNKNEDNIIKYSTFLKMLKQVRIREIKKVEEEQNKLNQKVPFKVKFEGNYLWQIYYSENTDKYFMIVSTQDTEYATFFYLLKKKLEKNKTDKVFVPVTNVGYSKEYLKKSEFEDIENYMWLFTKDWPLVYEVYDKNNELSIQIIGETRVYEKIKSPYRIKLENKEEANQFYRLLKAMFILQTELPNYFSFKTNIGKAGKIEFYIKNKNIRYENILEWIQEEFKTGEERIQIVEEVIEIQKKKLDDLKVEISAQEIEYLSKEKQISTFLECKKTFLGKFKYYFKYNKKKNKDNVNGKRKVEIEEQLEHCEEKTKDKNKIKNRKHHTIEQLIELYKEVEQLENTLKNIVLDVNSLKLKKKNMAKKIENATLFIEEIDSHKKSIFEFWKYSNKDEIAVLPEGEAEEVNIIKKITKVFDYEEDIENFGKTMDKIQRKVLTKQETDSIYITSTNIIDILTKVKNDDVELKEVAASLRKLKKEAIEEKNLTENDEFNFLGGAVQDLSKISKINEKKHREIAKDKFAILEINKNTKPIGYKLALESVAENIKKALKKVTISEDLPVYKVVSGNLLDEKEINIFNINPESEIKQIIKEDQTDEINFYKINLKRGINGIAFTNCIFYDNQNKTLPVGQDISTKILIDISKINIKLKKKTSFRIVNFEKENSDFSRIKIKKVRVFECEVQ